MPSAFSPYTSLGEIKIFPLGKICENYSRKFTVSVLQHSRLQRTAHRPRLSRRLRQKNLEMRNERRETRDEFFAKSNSGFRPCGVFISRLQITFILPMDLTTFYASVSVEAAWPASQLPGHGKARPLFSRILRQNTARFGGNIIHSL
jgi:hypothetical protein